MDPQTSAPDSSAMDDFLGRPPQSNRARLLRRYAPVAALLLLGALAYLIVAGDSTGTVNFATAPVQRGDLRVTVAATGNLQPTSEVEVGSELSGLITSVLVDNNDQVRQGQVLARLDTSRLQDTIVQGQASLQAALAGVAQAEATAGQARAVLARLEEVPRAVQWQGPLSRRTRHSHARSMHARSPACAQPRPR